MINDPICVVIQNLMLCILFMLYPLDIDIENFCFHFTF